MKNQGIMRAVSLAVVAAFVVAQAAIVSMSAEPQIKRGTVIRTEETFPGVNMDDVREVQPGTEIDMVISTALATDMSLMGDEFFAKVSKNISVDGKVVIPKDSIVHASVGEKVNPKWAGRNGYMSAKFDYIITPDGREIPINGDFTTKKSGLKRAARIVGRSTGYTLAGGAVGAFMVLKYGGLAAVAATEGYALAGGAAVGGAVGLGTSLVTKGKHKMLPPGTEIRVTLGEGLKLPTMDMPDESADNIVLEGLDVDVLGMALQKDPFGEVREMTMTIDISNYTPHTFSFFDIGMMDEYGTVFYASPFGDTGMWFRKITPNNKVRGNLSFNLDNPRGKHYLVFFKRYTREPLAKIAITDAMEVDKKTAKKLRKTAANK